MHEGRGLSSLPLCSSFWKMTGRRWFQPKGQILFRRKFVVMVVISKYVKDYHTEKDDLFYVTKSLKKN